MLKNKDENGWKEGTLTWNESMCSTNQVCKPSGPQLTPAQDKSKSAKTAKSGGQNRKRLVHVEIMCIFLIIKGMLYCLHKSGKQTYEVK